MSKLFRLDGFQLEDSMMKMYYNSTEAIIFLNSKGVVLALNPAAEGLLSQEVLEQINGAEVNVICKFCKGYTNEEDLMSCLNCFLIKPDKDFTSFQVYIKLKDGTIAPFTASYKMIDAEQKIYVLTLLDLTKQSKMREALYRSKMTKYIIKAQEDERKRISRELHDCVAQELISSLVDIRVLKYMNLNEDALKKLKQTEESLARLLDEIRNLSVELRPASLDDLGLDAAFRSHFKWVENNYGILVHFSAELFSARYSNEIETVVYRICQEAILNAIKYAHTEEIYVRLYEENGDLILIVEDKGAGFDVQFKEPKGTGLGLYGMRERAELVNGILNIQSEMGKGTRIQIRIPVRQENTVEEV